MIWQWIIVALLVIAAAIYITRLIVRTIRSRGCPGCMTSNRTLKKLKKLSSTNNS